MRRGRSGSARRRPGTAGAAQFLAGFLMIVLVAQEPPECAAAELVGDPARPGPAEPIAGRSLLSELFAADIPFPFAALLDRLKLLAGPGNVKTALIPLGRSLQRFSAHPDYFASPRVVVAVTNDNAAGPRTMRLADRFFLGYQPAAQVIEAISYNEDAGRFEFQEIANYTKNGPAKIRQAERSICVTCHQNHGPIFPRPLWSESNANVAVAARMIALGDRFQGARRRQSIDAVAAFDEATDRAARIALANRLWADGCGSARCRSALLLGALRYGLNGKRPGWSGPRSLQAASFAKRAAGKWPGGLATTSFDLPNRDPLHLFSRTAPADLYETEGVLNPATPRAPVLLWRPAEDSFDAAARAIASMLSSGDFAWLDALLQQGRAVSAPVTGAERPMLDCTQTIVTRDRSGPERRFSCAGAGVSLQGFVSEGANQFEGRVYEFRMPAAPRLRNLSARAVRSNGMIDIHLYEQGAGLAARLADGRRIDKIRLLLEAGRMRAQVHIADDIKRLADALNGLSKAGDRIFAAGPFRRRGILKAIKSVLAGKDG